MKRKKPCFSLQKALHALLLIFLLTSFLSSAKTEETPQSLSFLLDSPYLVKEVDPAHITAPFPPVPPCFEGKPDYQYFSSTLAIQIKKQSKNRITYFICDIQTTNPYALRAGLSHGKPRSASERTSVIAAREEAILAINGDNYGTHSYGIIIRSGALIRAAKTTRHMLALDANGALHVIANRGMEKPEALAKRLVEAGIRHTWEFGPELIRAGEKTSLKIEFPLISVKDSILEPRTAIGQISPLHYVIIVVDGRRAGYSMGVSLSGLQQLMLDAGAQIAFNLDGGGSTTLVFLGEVINRPSGGKERAVSDILYFK